MKKYKVTVNGTEYEIVLEQMDENDILVYTDAGCTINKNGRNRFDEYTQNSLESYCLSRV